MLRHLPLLFLCLLSPCLPAQIALSIGDEAPRISPTEFLVNYQGPGKRKGRFTVLTLCKTWDGPCFEALESLDALRATVPDDNLVFLTVFRGNPDAARKDVADSQTTIPVATDLYGKTQIRYGDGEAELLSWPYAFLIDNQNILGWQGDVDNLTPADLQRFANAEHPVMDDYQKYVPLAADDYLFVPMTSDDLDDLAEADSVDSFVRVWPKSELTGRSFGYFQADRGSGFYGPATLENVFSGLFPKKRLVIPGDIMENEYLVAFVQRTVDRHTEDRIAYSILREIGLDTSVATLPATYYELEIANPKKLAEPRAVSIKNKLPEDMKDLGSHSDRDLHNFEVRQFSLAQLAQLLNRYSPDRWSYKGTDYAKYNFTLDVTSTKALLKSLRQVGLSASGRKGFVEEIHLERVR